MIRVVLASLVLAVPAVVVAQETPKPVAPAEKKVCKRERIPGSQFGSRRVCKTVVERERLEEEADLSSIDVISKNNNDSFRSSSRGGPN